MKMVQETAKILDPAIRMTTTAVRMPVVNGHSESINVELRKPYELDDVRQLFEEAPGVVVQDDPANNVYPLALTASGTDPVFVGRLRRDYSADNALNFWFVSDNLRKGAALNSVQITVELIKRDLVRVP